MKKFLQFLVPFLMIGCTAAHSWDSKTFENFKNETPRVLIIGAAGSVAREATNGFLQATNANLRLFLRNAQRLESVQKANPNRVELFEGDATNLESLKAAMAGVDIVYANLAGRNLGEMAAQIIAAMKAAGVSRLIWVGSYGVYDGEIPESEMDRIRAYNPPHRQAVAAIEKSDLNYTIIRAEWFSGKDEIDYELTQKGEPFKNPSAYISRKSIAHLVIRLCLEKNFGNRASLGINKPAK